MMEEKATEILDDCVNLKILRRVDDSLGVDPAFHTFFNDNIEIVTAKIPEVVMNMDKDEDKTFAMALATIIIGYTKVTDPQRILDLVRASNAVFKALKEYEKLGDADGK